MPQLMCSSSKHFPPLTFSLSLYVEHVLSWVGVEFLGVAGFCSEDSQVPDCIKRCSCWQGVQMKARNLTDLLSIVGSNQGFGDNAGKPPQTRALPRNHPRFNLHLSFAAAFQLDLWLQRFLMFNLLLFLKTPWPQSAEAPVFWRGQYYFLCLRAGYSSRLNKSGVTLC